MSELRTWGAALDRTVAATVTAEVVVEEASVVVEATAVEAVVSTVVVEATIVVVDAASVVDAVSVVGAVSVVVAAASVVVDATSVVVEEVSEAAVSPGAPVSGCVVGGTVDVGTGLPLIDSERLAMGATVLPGDADTARSMTSGPAAVADEVPSTSARVGDPTGLDPTRCAGPVAPRCAVCDVRLRNRRRCGINPVFRLFPPATSNTGDKK
ncbi:MAG: hypothetical protein ABIR32_16620 [Ilumatobacteraceae bacterium]